MMARCALCDSEITRANWSREHIIPQAIGGRKKVLYFICRECNNSTGSEWDAELARQLNWFCVALNIKRESGTPSPSYLVKTLSGQQLKMHAHGSLSPAFPEYKEELIENGKRVQFVARTTEEALGFLKRTQKKHPDALDYNTLRDKLQMTSAPLQEPLHISLEVGGPVTGRSIAKSTLAMACALNIPRGACETVIQYLLDRSETVPWAAFHLRDLIKNRPAEYLFHVVAIAGDAVSRQLLGYVEYFGAFRFVVVLNQCYQGPDIRGSYAVNPQTGEKIDVEVDLALSRAEVEQVLSNESFLLKGLRSSVNAIMPYVIRELNANGRERVLDEIIATSFEDCGVLPGEELPPERFAEFSALVAQRVAEFLFPRVSQRN